MKKLLALLMVSLLCAALCVPALAETNFMFDLSVKTLFVGNTLQLTLDRADNAVQTAVLSEISLSTAAEDCALAFEPVAFEAGKTLEYHIAEDVEVLGDRDKLRQVVSVLLDNAIKYGAPAGTITLTLQKTDRQARLTVSNPGDPIPPEQLRRLFERFYRADASRGEQSGFGLGLPIAAAIAAEHKGTLKAESDAASTRFIFTMPLLKK